MSMQSDPFASVRAGRVASTEASPAPPETRMESQEDPFSSVRLKKSQEMPWLYETGRHATRVASRIAETIGGIPGDVSSLLESGLFAGMEKLTGKKLSPEQKELASSRHFPTSGELKSLSQSATKGFTTPQGETEKTVDEFAETVGSLLGPLKFRRALGVGLLGVGAKKGAKTLGAGEGSQEAAKLGTMFLATLYNPGGALKYASSQFDKANQLAKGASIQAMPLKENLEKLMTSLKEGVTTPSKSAVMRPAEELIAKVQRGKIRVTELTAAKRDLNTLMKDPLLLTREKKLLKTVGREIDQAIRPYEKINPAFSKAYRPANEIYGAVMQGNKASDFINKTLGAKSILAAVLGEAVLGHPQYILPTAGTAVGIAGTATSFDFLSRLARSSELRKFYSKALIAAAMEDAPALRKYEEKIKESIKE